MSTLQGNIQHMHLAYAMAELRLNKTVATHPSQCLHVSVSVTVANVNSKLATEANILQKENFHNAMQCNDTTTGCDQGGGPLRFSTRSQGRPNFTHDYRTDLQSSIHVRACTCHNSSASCSTGLVPMVKT